MKDLADTPATAAVIAALDALGAALERGDVAAAAALFEPDGYWRDLVAMTWNIATMEGQIGQKVIPDRVMQTQRVVAVAPAIPRARVLFHHDRRHVQLPQPRRKRNAALPAADDHHFGLGRVAQACGFGGTRLGPGLAGGTGTVHHARRAGGAHGFGKIPQPLQ